MKNYTFAFWRRSLIYVNISNFVSFRQVSEYMNPWPLKVTVKLMTVAFFKNRFKMTIFIPHNQISSSKWTLKFGKMVVRYLILGITPTV